MRFNLLSGMYLITSHRTKAKPVSRASKTKGLMRMANQVIWGKS